jgi:hypothetical protein
MDRNNLVPHNTEDRHWWYKHGENLEKSFSEFCIEKLSLNIVINPEKITNPTVPDLLFENKLADLKTQNVPFFMSTKYGMDPRFTVTFNRKDYNRYSKLYPDIDIFFWVNWTQTSWKDKSVEFLYGIYKINFQDLKKIIDDGSPEHYYKHRMNDGNLNAKSSFLLDIRKFELIFQDI